MRKMFLCFTFSIFIFIAAIPAKESIAADQETNEEMPAQKKEEDSIWTKAKKIGNEVF